MNMIAKAIVGWAKRTPYFHLHHADGSVYMGRWWLFRTPWLSARIHHIATPDFDRHFHDHPFGFVSVILSGWYVERRPTSVDPCFDGASGRETGVIAHRRTGSVAWRRCTDRHIIDRVSPGGAWTLVFVTPKRQWWGFYTPEGKVFWADYPIMRERGQAPRTIHSEELINSQQSHTTTRERA